MAETVLLGIDIGTSSSKGVLVTADGRVVARATKPHETSYPHPGWVEHDAEDVWWADFRALVSELLPAVEGRTLAGLGVSGIGPVLLPADGDGNPLRPAILYGVDTRATEQIAALTEELGADEILRRGGSALSSQAVGPKIRWLAEHEPETYRRTEMLLMCSSYLVHRLTGRYVLDHHSASQCDPLYDLAARDWSAQWAARVAPDLPLPELAWPTEVVGHVGARAAAETGLPEGLPVTAGTVDAWAEATSVGVRKPGDVMLMYGTTMFFVQVLTDPHPHPALWGTCGAFPDTYTLAAGMATSGAVTDWLRKLVDGEFADLVEQAAQAPAGSRGLLLLPYFAGERTPIFDPDARGILAGLTTSHGRGELYRAALEGIAYGVRHNLEAMSEAGGTAGRLVAVGGGTQGGLWTQIVSDVTGQEQQVPGETVGAAFGDALLAGVGTGAAVAPDEWNPIATTVRPNPANHDRYDAFYRHYRDLYEATTGIAHFLAEEQRAAD
ncbi:xylulokinase [Saccharopolyspora erythraea NRRL 2338]|uniref:Carbohydrate kinase, FGGY n=2 Tax=Saccharopolyspora erythraea TaxID=1836 RepID=A4F8A8_SACEN|nr:FGGY-family carbohydrate kinase [Saccharopolyspora erythraea]EQD85319.1 sugar kinase [Saccharopolyspora erythraea D]PFG94077.1 xylulokinase [Saccharopolyspora erythraea NRRL 2338]QRK90873.1 FGGY-family carbohydrate kinase [Saccharopolyspora erythraea]CAM00283.1 carbohydrate kinase, FGGY [Saccharopolyspora erythraea NRRL 2338]